MFFSAHAVLVTGFTIFQCFIYERNHQRVSNIAIGILCLIFLLIILCIVAVAFHWFTWLSPLIVIIIFSNIKLVISFIKYFPQLIFNYRRKSTYPFILNILSLPSWILLDGQSTTFFLISLVVLCQLFSSLWIALF